MNIQSKVTQLIKNRLTEIDKGNFSQDTVKLLLIELREYVPKKSAIRDISDFVAHPERDRGIILDSVNYAYNRSRVLFRQIEGSKTKRGLELDINIIPEDIYDTVMWHYIKIKPDRNKLQKFQNSFKYNKLGKIYTPCVQIIPFEIITYIQEAISLLSLQPVLKQSEIINGIVKFLNDSCFSDFIETIKIKQNEIMVCIIALLHGASFLLKDGNKATASIGNDIGADLINGQIRLDLERKIHLKGIVKTDLSHVSIAFELITTDLSVGDYFSKNMFNMESGFPRSDYKDSDHIEAKRTNDGKMVFVKQ